MVAFTPDVSAEDVVDLTASVLEVLPRSTITARQIQPSEIRDQLRKGVADIALSRGISEADRLASMIVEHTPLAIAVAKEHHLADRGTIAFGDLRGDILALPGGSENPYARTLFAIARQAGLNPATATAPIQGVTPTASVIGTTHFALVTAEPGLYHRSRVVVLSLSPPLITPLHALWLPHTENPLSQALADFRGSHCAPSKTADRSLKVGQSLKHCTCP